MKHIIKNLLLTLVLLILILLVWLRFSYGGGNTYTDVSTTPLYTTSNNLEKVFEFNRPMGNIAVSRDSNPRLFFTVHPESRPKPPYLYEIVENKAVPYPSANQSELFTTVLGLYCDNQQRLWTIDHGNHGISGARIQAIDLRNGEIVHDFTFPREIAEIGSFFNDLCISPDGRIAYIADVSFFGKNPSLIVYDIGLQKAVSVLDKHASTISENYVPVTPQKKMSFFGGLATLTPGIDGIDIDPMGLYLYWAPMSGSKMYRIKTSELLEVMEDPAAGLEPEALPGKPLSDGIKTDLSGNVYVTDVEHQGVMVFTPDRKYTTLIHDGRIRWADGLSLGGDGYMYLIDSGLQDVMMRSKKHMQMASPYNIYRFKTLGS